jgi:hypothetical protein
MSYPTEETSIIKSEISLAESRLTTCIYQLEQRLMTFIYWAQFCGIVSILFLLLMVCDRR